MGTWIAEVQYKDQFALSISSEHIAAQFLPLQGAKMCSLVYRPTGQELLVQRPGKVYRVQPYDGRYVEGECSGFDDMFPTIDECTYERAPWRGTRIPDHGEVWSIPWEWDADGERLHFATYGVRFPYRLEKWASFADEGRLRLDYRLTNLAPFEFDYLWAAHPMFVLEEGAELVLPAAVRRVVAVFTIGGSLGPYGHAFNWPIARLPDGTERDLRWMGRKSTRQAEKYFVQGRMPEGWCAVRYHRSDLTLALAWPVERVPYLGILPNEGGWDDLYNIFLEPCSAPFDRPDVARLHGALSSLGPRSSCEWYLEISICPGVTIPARAGIPSAAIPEPEGE